MLNPKAPVFEMPSSFNPNAPEFKPVQESSVFRPEAAEFIPMAGGWGTLQAVAEAYQNQHEQNKQKRAMPFATDEEWEQRIAKREKEVETIKSLTSYRLYIEVFPHEKRSEDDPKTPDPRDRTVSKRMWKWNVEKWRLQLKSRCVYSRAILLQCREELRRRASRACEIDSTVKQVSEAAVAEEDEDDSPASGNQSGAVGSSLSAGLQRERFLKTLRIPDQPQTIPSATSRRKDKSAAAAASGTGGY